MATLNTGPCELTGWVPDESCLKLPDGTTPEQRETWRRAAAEILYMRTGQRFGPSCPVTVRPCRKSCAEGYGQFFNQGQFNGGFRSTGGFIPYLSGGRMFNATLCGCTTDCHCGPELCEIELPGPIYDIESVDISGTTIDPTLYFSYNARFLVLRPEVADVHPDLDITCWPSCQDLSQPSGSPDTFSVTYSTGQAAPAMAGAAVTEIMNHLAQQCDGCGCGTDARQNLTSLSRQGVSLEFADPQQVFTDDRIGLPISDLFVSTFNPGKLPRAMRVLSPDAPRRPRIELGY